MRPLALVAATVLVASPAMTAHADPYAPGIRLHRDVHVVPLTHGYLVEVVCNASADPGVLGHVAVTTAVGCSIDGETVSQVAPGAEAVTEITAAWYRPLTFCIWGEAAFVDPVSGSARTAEGPPECETLTF